MFSYYNDIRIANERVTTGSKIIDTDCGPIESATLGEGPPVLVLHGTSGGWDQGIYSARGLVSHGFQTVNSRRLGVLNEGNTQGTLIRYPLEQVTTPTLFISAADDLYKTLLVARHAARIIPN